MVSHADRRKFIIAKIRETMAKAEREGLEIDREKLIMVLGADEGIARRTAIDYIKCAKLQLENSNSDIQRRWAEALKEIDYGHN